MLLKFGSSGDDIKKLQEKLGLTADGIFGPGTQVKVKEWQAANGLTADGIVGDGTWGKMFTTSTPVTPSAPVMAGSIDLSKLKGHVPDAVIAQLPDTMAKFSINTPLRLAHFLSQAGHESGGFRLVHENLNYSAKGLRGTFGKYFTTDAIAAQYERQPEKIANKVYGSRMGNGNEASGEGWKYHGRGYIQLTGKDNYKAFTTDIGEDCVANPDLVATKYPLASAGWFFKRCLAKADQGATIDAVKSVTRCVNGGEIGLDDRFKHFNEYWSILK